MPEPKDSLGEGAHSIADVRKKAKKEAGGLFPWVQGQTIDQVRKAIIDRFNPIIEIETHGLSLVQEVYPAEDDDGVQLDEDFVRLSGGWLKKSGLFAYIIARPGSFHAEQGVQVFKVTRKLEVKGKKPDIPRMPYGSNSLSLWADVVELTENFVALPLGENQKMLTPRDLENKDQFNQILANSFEIVLLPNY